MRFRETAHLAKRFREQEAAGTIGRRARPPGGVTKAERVTDSEAAALRQTLQSVVLVGGPSDAELARRAGVSTTFIRLLRTGARAPSVQTLARLRRVLDEAAGS